MSIYRLEVRADYPRHKGQPTDIAAEVFAPGEKVGVAVLRADAGRIARTDLVRVAVTFEAGDDDHARQYRDALPNAIRFVSAEADSLRTGIGRSFRNVR